MLTEKEKLDRLTQLGVELNQVNDLDILMERVLTEARRFVNADAGSIYIRDKKTLLFSYTQNDTLQRDLPQGKKLIYSTFTLPINKETIAGYVADTGQILNITDAYAIEPTQPYGFNQKFDEASGYRTRSILTIPLTMAGGDIIGILQIINARDEAAQTISFGENDEKMMLHFASIAAVALERAKLTRSILLRMISMAELRDPKETGAHVNRVAGYSIEIYEQWAQQNGLSQEEIDKARDVLRMAAILHDVGKVAISDLILKKPARLDNDEYELMKQHTVLGARLFQDRRSDFDEAASLVALNHHERWDGKGYPGYVDVADGSALEGYALPDGSAQKKKGEEIPLFGRIVAIADVYDALSSKRSYKDPWDEEKILSVLKEESGAHFEPEIVEIFFSRFDVIKSIQERYLED
ncbi:HD domain-containing phosphohydrolase [Thermodesulfobacteriota bacterium]